MRKTPPCPTLDRRTLLRAGAAAATGISAATAASAPAPAAGSSARVEPDLTERILRNWPATATKAAKEMIERYGQPNEATAGLLIWHGNGPWKRTVVHREEIDHKFPMPHKDVLEQFIPYRVPPEKFDELARYDGSVIVERTKGEISARCDKEAANFLALNLAHDIVTGKRDVEDARRFYADAIKQMMAGNPPEYTQKLLFEVPRTYEGDPDETIMRG